MRLDHLLSREPSFVGDKQRGLLGCVGCFLVPACVYCPGSGVVGVGAFFGLGIKRFSAAVWWWGAFKHTVGFTFNTV